MSEQNEIERRRDEIMARLTTERDAAREHAQTYAEENRALREQLRGAVSFTPLEREALLGLVSMIANDGLDTYGLAGKEQAAVGRALAKLARGQ